MKSLAASLMVLAASAAVAAPPSPSLEWILEKHTQARGGRDAIEAVHGIRMDIAITEPKYTAEGRYTATRDGSMRIDVFIGGDRVFTEALDRGQAWSRAAGESAPGVTGSSAGAAALRHGVEAPFKLFGLHEMQSRGHRLRYVGRVAIDQVDYYALEATLDDGYQTTYYLDPTTWLIARERQYRALHVDVDPTPEWIETSFDDYRLEAGVQYSHRQVERQVATGNVLVTTVVRSITVNPPLDDTLFQRP
jgi:hypothetical protein